MTKVPTEKRCTRCGVVKPVSEFWRRREGRHGLQAQCRSCKGIAQARYHRAKRHSFEKPAIVGSSPWRLLGELWRAIQGWDGYYEVSDLGRVRRLPRSIALARGGHRLFPGRILEGGDRDGYRAVLLCRDNKAFTRLVHRLVANAFLPNPKGKTTVHHKNAQRSDNRANNLEWVSPKENTGFALEAGVMAGPRGEQASNSRLTETDVHWIREHRTRLSQPEMARALGVSRTTVNSVLNGYSWAWLSES